MSEYIEAFLQCKMDSLEGDELRSSLEAVLAEEKVAIELFKIQIQHCSKQIDGINTIAARKTPTHELMAKKRAFEEHKTVLNIAAQIQQCSYEVKGVQKILYFEKGDSSRERIIAEVSLMVYEWCEDLLEMTGRKFQKLAEGLLIQSDLLKFRIARQRLKDFFDREKASLSSVRHNVGAHRDHDFMAERAIIDKFDWVRTVELLSEFEHLILGVSPYVQTLISAGLNQIDQAFNKN